MGLQAHSKAFIDYARTQATGFARPLTLKRVLKPADARSTTAAARNRYFKLNRLGASVGQG